MFQVEKVLNLHELSSSTLHHTQGCSALDGQGLQPGLEKLYEMILKRKKMLRHSKKKRWGGGLHHWWGYKWLFGATTCLRTVSADMYVLWIFSGWDQREAVGPFRQVRTSTTKFKLWLLSLCQNTFLHPLDIQTDLPPLGSFLLLSTPPPSHPFKKHGRETYSSSVWQRKTVQYMMNTHWCTHSNAEGYFVPLLIQTVVSTETFGPGPKRSSCSFH